MAVGVRACLLNLGSVGFETPRNNIGRYSELPYAVGFVPMVHFPPIPKLWPYCYYCGWSNSARFAVNCCRKISNVAILEANRRAPSLSA